MSSDKKNTVILANGAFPSHDIPLGILTEAGFIVCCDGAVEKLLAHQLTPDAIVGDLDSVSAEVRQRYSDRIIHDPDQETNDLTKAVHWCHQHGYDDLVILGATGLREDHTLGNISLLAEYSKIVNARIVTDNGVFETLSSSATISSFSGQQISIFSINSLLAVTSEGLKYPLNSLVLDNWWKGTLNEALGESFRLSFTGGPLIIFKSFS